MRHSWSIPLQPSQSVFISAPIPAGFLPIFVLWGMPSTLRHFRHHFSLSYTHIHSDLLATSTLMTLIQQSSITVGISCHGSCMQRKLSYTCIRKYKNGGEYLRLCCSWYTVELFFNDKFKFMSRHLETIVVVCRL